MPRIPRDRSFDSTIGLLLDGYDYISERCRRNRSDIFRTRLLLRKTVCMSGRQWARALYEDGRFRRKGAAPKRVLETEFYPGGGTYRQVALATAKRRMMT